MRIDSLHPITSARLSVIDVDAPLRGAALSLSKPATGLVVVCLSFDDPLGFQVLSMLKLDRDTSRIPIVTSFAAADCGDEPS